MSYSKTSQLHYLLALAYIPHVGPITTKLLFDKFPNLEELFLASSETLTALNLPFIIEHIKNPAWDKVEQNLKWAEEPSHHIISIFDDSYPALLKETASAPIILFAEGNIVSLATTQIAIVGSRNPSPSGAETAYIFATSLATAGLTITSGLALGIDSASHQGALNAQQPTIAVLGSGLDVIYPYSNLKLAKNISENHGLLLSEFPLGTKPHAQNFPQRNRIISGLSLGVLVVEATLRSGSLITARCALEQGREVFAIPGSINNPYARGCHALIKQGAKLVETINDILEELNFTTQAKINPQPVLNNTKIKNNLDLKQRKLLECVNFEVTPVDLLVKRSGFTAKEVTTLLLALELLGLVQAVPGGYSKKQ